MHWMHIITLTLGIRQVTGTRKSFDNAVVGCSHTPQRQRRTRDWRQKILQTFQQLAVCGRTEMENTESRMSADHHLPLQPLRVDIPDPDPPKVRQRPDLVKVSSPPRSARPNIRELHEYLANLNHCQGIPYTISRNYRGSGLLLDDTTQISSQTILKVPVVGAGINHQLHHPGTSHPSSWQAEEKAIDLSTPVPAVKRSNQEKKEKIKRIKKIRSKGQPSREVKTRNIIQQVAAQDIPRRTLMSKHQVKTMLREMQNRGSITKEEADQIMSCIQPSWIKSVRTRVPTLSKHHVLSNELVGFRP